MTVDKKSRDLIESLAQCVRKCPGVGGSSLEWEVWENSAESVLGDALVALDPDAQRPRTLMEVFCPEEVQSRILREHGRPKVEQ